MIVATQWVGYREHLCVSSHCNLKPRIKTTDPQTRRQTLNPKTQREQQALTGILLMQLTLQRVQSLSSKGTYLLDEPV